MNCIAPPKSMPGLCFLRDLNNLNKTIKLNNEEKAFTGCIFFRVESWFYLNMTLKFLRLQFLFIKLYIHAVGVLDVDIAYYIHLFLSSAIHWSKIIGKLRQCGGGRGRMNCEMLSFATCQQFVFSAEQ